MQDADDTAAQWERALRAAMTQAHSPPGTAEGRYISERYEGPNAMFRLATEALREGNPQAFIDHVSKNAGAFPRSPGLLRCLALCHNSLGRNGVAVELLDEAHRKHVAGEDPGDLSLTLAAMSAVESDRGDKERAWALISQACDLDPANVTHHYNRACLASVMGDRARLARSLEQLDANTEWQENPEVRRFMLVDAELRFLRDEEPDLWAPLLDRIERKEGRNE